MDASRLGCVQLRMGLLLVALYAARARVWTAAGILTVMFAVSVTALLLIALQHLNK
jgi:hypothetical protein